MTIGLNQLAPVCQTWNMPMFAQFGGTKNYWVDLIIIAVLMGGAVYAVCRSSRRY